MFCYNTPQLKGQNPFMNQPPEKRKYERYDTALKLYFDRSFEVETKVKYQLLDKQNDKPLSRKYAALSKNVSAEGLSFLASQQLTAGDYLHLEVYLPTATKPVHMEGEVRWSNPAAADKREGPMFQTGVLLTKVNGEAVDPTIHFDKQYQVSWSNVLESVLGNFKNLAKKNIKK